MTVNWLHRGVLAAALALPALGGSASAFADDIRCSNATLKGEYAIKLHGQSLGIVTAAGPQIFPDPIPADGVGIEVFDGNVKFSHTDFVMRGGAPLPGPKDPTTGFNPPQ